VLSDFWGLSVDEQGMSQVLAKCLDVITEG